MGTLGGDDLAGLHVGQDIGDVRKLRWSRHPGGQVVTTPVPARAGPADGVLRRDDRALQRHRRREGAGLTDGVPVRIGRDVRVSGGSARGTRGRARGHEGGGLPLGTRGGRRADPCGRPRARRVGPPRRARRARRSAVPPSLRRAGCTSKKMPHRPGSVTADLVTWGHYGRGMSRPTRLGCPPRNPAAHPRSQLPTLGVSCPPSESAAHPRRQLPTPGGSCPPSEPTPHPS